jgi:catechol 2,3-dioxygenase-like lactoylglutathione lyase family enzyme
MNATTPLDQHLPRARGSAVFVAAMAAAAACGLGAGLSLSALAQTSTPADHPAGATAASAAAPANPYGGAGQNLPHVDHPAPVQANSKGFYGLEHTHIFSADINRSIHFYVDLLGFTQATQVEDTPVNPRMDNLLGLKNAHYKMALLNMPGGPSYGTHVPQIEIWEITGVPLDKGIYNNPVGNFQGKGYNAYRVKNLAEIITRLKAQGVKFVSEPNLNPVYHLPGAVYMVDPDGQVIELNNYWGQDSK